MKICLLFREEIKYLFGGKVPPVVILITLPVIFTALFGIIYEENVVNHIPLAIYDQDQTSLSRKLVQMYEDAERFRAVSYVSDDEEMEKEIRTGNVKAALIIPADFSKNIQSGQGTNILLTVNSANNMFGNATLSAAQEINRSFTVAISEKLLEGTGLLPAEAVSTAYSIRLGVRILGNPANGYSPFMLSGLLLNGLQIGIMIVLSPYLYDELQRRKKRHGIGEWLLPLVRAVPYGLFAFIGYCLALCMAVNIFSLPMRGSWTEAMLLGICFIIFVMGAISLFSICAPIRIMTLQAPMLYIMPGLLYSGLSWPIFDMSEYATAFAFLLPMTYAGDTLRDILLMSYAPSLLENCVRMVIGGLLAAFLSICIFWLRSRDDQGWFSAGTGA